MATEYCDFCARWHEVKKEPCFRLCRTDEAARLLGVSKRTLYYWIKQGRVEKALNSAGMPMVKMPTDLSQIPKRYSRLNRE